jgi:hypothetical protein
MKKCLKVFLPVFVLAFVGITLFSAGALKAHEIGSGLNQTGDPSVTSDSGSTPPENAFNLVEYAVMNKDLTRKDGVLLKANLLFDPGAISPAVRTSVLRGMTTINEPCLTGFYDDVHRVYDQLSPAEKTRLASLSEDLRVIIAAKEREASGKAPGEGHARASLPNFGLDKKVEGTCCTVNYTTAGANATTAAYAQLVKVYMDMAYVAETKKFRAAHAEPGGTGDKLQVYILSLGVGTWGLWVPVSTVSGKAMSGYIKITSNMKAEGGADWQVKLKGTCYHEYFHGVQAAYNAGSSLWFREGTCRWAETYWAANWGIVKNSFSDPLSVFAQPDLPIWQGTSRKYTTVTLAYYLADKYGKDDFIVSYLEATEKENDAILVLQDLMHSLGTTFEEEFKNFWIAMYTKNITSLKKYMTNVRREYANSYGSSDTLQVYQFGARFHQLKTMPGAPIVALMYEYWFVPMFGIGRVEAFSFTDKSKTKVDIRPANFGDNNYSYTPDFGRSVKEVVIVYTDTAYTAQDSSVRTATFEYLLPYVKITRTTTEPRIMQAGKSSKITFTYNLLGTRADLTTFPMFIELTEKDSVADYITSDYEVASGNGKTWTCYFNTSATATPRPYMFTVEFSVPSKAWNTNWGIPQVKSASRFSITVTKPRGQGSGGRGGGSTSIATSAH